ncbi:DinB family protein [Streptomyces sp. NPDC050516]|uniref:DinB family protein n=1 Tax=Streptomyces sp. NPDC050516 TaxID=3365621 RepID=UPI003799CA2D
MSDHQRTEPAKTADDRTSLTAFLDHQRETLAWKCAGLSAEQLKQKAVPTSRLTLLGLVRHAVEVERSWFRLVLNGERLTSYWPRTADGEFGEFHVADADVDEAFAAWRAACEDSRSAADAFNSLDETVEFREETISLRYILTHMIEEYARHNGHADLLREAIDGTTGE